MMTELERLIAIQEIRNLEARRVRCFDERDWEGYVTCHTPDTISYTFQTLGLRDQPIVGARTLAEVNAAHVDGSVTVNHIHEPEIEFTSETEVTGVWPVENLMWTEVGEETRWMHAFGHYRVTYAKRNGKWLIASRGVKRFRTETGVRPNKLS